MYEFDCCEPEKLKEWIKETEEALEGNHGNDRTIIDTARQKLLLLSRPGKLATIGTAL